MTQIETEGPVTPHTKIAVTAASGNLGTLVIDELVTRRGASGVIAIVRDRGKAQPLRSKGVDVRIADYEDPPALEAALKGVDRVLLVSGTEYGRRAEQHGNVVRAAKSAGVGFIAYTSAPLADTTDLVLAPEHLATERIIRKSGVPFCILRNNWYVENYDQDIATARSTGEIVTSTRQGRIAIVPRADLAVAHAIVLTEDGHEGSVYELGGDEALTWDEMAPLVGAALGRAVVHRGVTSDEHLAMLVAAGLDEETAKIYVAIDANIASGALDVTTGDLRRILGRRTTPFRDALAA